jgi:hypothetical protein
VFVTAEVSVLLVIADYYVYVTQLLTVRSEKKNVDPLEFIW